MAVLYKSFALQMVDQARASLGPATSVLAKDRKELAMPFDGETRRRQKLTLGLYLSHTTQLSTYQLVAEEAAIRDAF